jgi:subtilisin family serine protease
MVALSRCVQVSALIAGSIWSGDAARITRKQEKGEVAGTKFVGGVPILNYHLAYGGSPSLAEAGQDEKWVVMLKRSAKESDIKKFCAGFKCKLSGNPQLGGVPFVELLGTEKDLEVAMLTSKGLARFVEPNLEAHAIPEFSAQASSSWGLTRVGASTAAKTGAGVHAYVLDTGVRTSHTDFGGRAISTLDLTSDSVVECGGDENCAGDGQGHGSHCAGTVAGKTYGVAPGATIHGVKVLSNSGSGSWSWSYSALDWVATKGDRPALCSMSLGGAGTVNAMADAVDAAVDAGVTVVVAGGNDNSDACGFSPAYVPSAITVGSTTEQDTRSSFSNFGSCTDIWAPGSDITSASHESDTGSATMSGTSMACPHVSGGAALVLEANPSWGSAQVLESMLSTSTKGAVDGLYPEDINNLLCVGTCDAGSPAPPATTPDPCPYSWCGSYCWYGPCQSCSACR